MNTLKTFFIKYSAWIPILLLVIIVFFGILSSYNDEFNLSKLTNDVKRDLKMKALSKWIQKRNENRREFSFDERDITVYQIKVSESLNEDFNTNYLWKYSGVKINLETNIDFINQVYTNILTNNSHLDTLRSRNDYLDSLEFENRIKYLTADEIWAASIVKLRDELGFDFIEIGIPDVPNDSASINEVREQVKFGMSLIEKSKGEFFQFRYEGVKKARIENILILLASALLLSFLISQIPKIGGGNKVSSQTDQLKKLEKELPKLLYYDLRVSEQKANELYSRSSLMLISGIIMSIVGIIVFSLTIPDPGNFKKEDLLISYTSYAIRPTLMLIFVESISFFLLRQYRVLIEDFKYFHKLFLRRLNYAECYQLLNEDNQSKHKALIESLLGEKLDGLLTEGQTTENIEGLKNAKTDDPTETLKIIATTLKGKGFDI